MSQHRFAVGENVYYQAPTRYVAAPGVYTIVGLLPERVYRIRSPAESYERTAAEIDLALAPQAAPTTDPPLLTGRQRLGLGKWR